MHRRKTDEPPESVALETLAVDFGLEGPVTATWNCETQSQQPSKRYGANDVTFRLHVCLIAFPDTQAEDNCAELLEQRESKELRDHRWLTAEQVREVDDVSPTIKSVWRSIEAAGDSE